VRRPALSSSGDGSFACVARSTAVPVAYRAGAARRHQTTSRSSCCRKAISRSSINRSRHLAPTTYVRSSAKPSSFQQCRVRRWLVSKSLTTLLGSGSVTRSTSPQTCRRVGNSPRTSTLLNLGSAGLQSPERVSMIRALKVPAPSRQPSRGGVFGSLDGRVATRQPHVTES
jgi:hypothetical protein